MLKSVKSLAVIAALSFSSLTQAALYEFEADAGKSVYGSSFDGLQASFDGHSNVLTWESENFTNKNGDVADGLWLVLNDGANGNPKGNDNLAIFYADFNDSDGAGNADNIGLWAFGYGGGNNPNSYRNQSFLGSFTDALINDGTTRGFSLDVSSIYSQLETDQPFNENIGIWFHPTWGTQSVVTDGQLSGFSFGSQAWYDRGRQTTVVTVSEPTTFVLLLLGIFGLIAARRKIVK